MSIHVVLLEILKIMTLFEACVILNVSSLSTPAEVKDAYRRLVRLFHPDLNPNDREAEARLKEINIAYNKLREHHEQRAKVMQPRDYGEMAKSVGGDRETTPNRFTEPMRGNFGRRKI